MVGYSLRELVGIIVFLLAVSLHSAFWGIKASLLFSPSPSEPLGETALGEGEAFSKGPGHKL